MLRFALRPATAPAMPLAAMPGPKVMSAPTSKAISPSEVRLELVLKILSPVMVIFPPASFPWAQPPAETVTVVVCEALAETLP